MEGPASIRPARPVRAPPPRTPVEPAGERPTFSVIIPAYQAADSVGGAIESALAQTLAPDEIVVCDDGSTDDLDAALAPYLDCIVLVRKENGGVASALNTAAHAASSEFVVRLDHDDRFLPERMEAIAELAVARPDLDLIATDAVLEVDGRVLARRGDLHWFPVDAGDQAAESLVHG